MTYHPSSKDLPNINFPKEIEESLEVIAESIHDRWAAKRLKEGWVYGEKRDDFHKTHPSLRPYSELPDAEKDYDRDTARETIKVLMSLGYKIHK